MKHNLFHCIFAAFLLLNVSTLSWAFSFKKDGIYYNINYDKTSVTVTYETKYYNSYSGSISIPSIVTYGRVTYNVTSIGSSAFEGCTGLTSVTIPNSVTSIGYYAFFQCSGLTSITIPNSVTSIGIQAFWGCSGLTSVTIPNSVTSIGRDAFYGCSGLTSVTIPSSVTSIEGSVFSGCTGLTSVTIPNSVTSIGYNAFSGCSSLTSITIPNSVTSIESSAFYGCSGLTSVTIPNSVTSIEERAFSGCTGLTSITIPESVTSIGNSAFSNCSGLTSVTLNANDIVSKTYSTSSNLGTIFGSQVKEYVLGDDLKGIGSYAFFDCSGLTSISIPNSVTSIREYAFAHCSGLTSVSIPNSVTSIGSDAFYGCSGLTSITIPESVTSIGDYAFIYCTGLTSINIPNNVTSIEERAFSGCTGLTSITIPNSVTSILNYAFEGCSGLTSITIPNSVTSIGSSAFSGCTGLTSINIPNNVTSIGKYVFSGCSNLTSIDVDKYNTYYDSRDNCNAIIQTSSNTLIAGCKSTVIPPSVTSIEGSAFSGCSGLTSITIPNSVTSIGQYAFSGCSGLTSITIPNSVTSIERSAFSDCSGLTSITIPSSVTSIGDWAFCNCTDLTSVTIPNSVTSIDDNAFYKCSGLTSVTIPNNVTSIGSSAFYGCSGLTSVNIPNSVTSIGNYAFDGCSGLEEVILNSNSIVSKTYTSTRNISTIFGSQVKKYIFGDNITGIGEYAFPSNTSIYVSAKSSLLAAWNYGICPYDLKTSVLLANPLPTVQTNTASSIHVSRNSSAEESGIISSESITAAGVTITKIGHTTKFTGLTPNTAYTVAYNSTIKYAGSTFSYSNEYRATTNALTLTTSQPKVISAGNVVVGAVSNLDDAEENAGFEWRRTDWSDDFKSNTGVAYLYEGTMEGYIRNLYTEKLWKVRPYYKSNSGNLYYGDWVGIDPTNTSYFEPTVHTYAKINVDGNSAQLSGYVQRGSDEVRRQGFMYWISESGARVAADAGLDSRALAASAVPSSAKTIEAEGRVMEVELTGLKPNTTYAYVAFVTTVEGETFYGKQLSFTTGDDPATSVKGDANGNGVVEIGDVTSVLTLMATPEATGYDNKAADANGNGVIEIGDVTTILTIMAGN